MSYLTFFLFCSLTTSSISISSSICYAILGGVCLGLTIGFLIEFALGFYLIEIDSFYLLISFVIYLGASLGTGGS
jgi:hypothetical protein